MLLNCEEIQPVHPKENQSWIFIGRTNAEAEIPILWPPDAKNWLIWKDPDAGKDWRQEEKGMTEDEMVRWHHWHSRCEFEQALGDGEGQGSLACCSPWGCQESDTTEWLNWTEGKTNHHGEQNKAITKWEQMQFPRDVSSQAQKALRGCVLRYLHQQGLASPISLEGKVHNQEKEGRSPRRCLDRILGCLDGSPEIWMTVGRLVPSILHPEQPEKGPAAGELQSLAGMELPAM